jgi:hypothetical protein
MGGDPSSLGAEQSAQDKCRGGNRVDGGQPRAAAVRSSRSGLPLVRLAMPELPLSASLLDAYRLERVLGVGGYATVYLAEDVRHHRPVAVKVLAPELSATIGTERFLKEIELTSALQHPHILPLFDSGVADGRLYYVMPFVDGETLGRRLERERQLPVADAVRLASEIADALDFAHRHGVVHRDIKPENILLDRKGRVKIADFGLAKLLGKSPADLTLTGAGQVMGTLHYMAPEQTARPLEVDHRADIYSLGVVFYEMLTGELPLGRFEPPSRKVAVDVRLDEVVLRALESQPERRYQHISDIKSEIEHITAGKPGQVHPHQFPMGKLQAAGVAPAFLLLFALGMIFSALLMAGGMAAAAYAVLTEPFGSNNFWSWMGAAFGCICGGGGSLAGIWNSYRQQCEGAGDLMRDPNWNWFDRVIVGYGSLGLVSFLAGIFLSPWLNGISIYAFFLLGGIVIFQAAFFLVIRGLLRRVAQQEAQAGARRAG